MLGFLQSPTAETILLVYVAYQLFSALIQSLPTPAEFGGVWYKAFYNFLSILIGDFKSFISKNPAFAAVSSSTTSGPSGIITMDKTAILSGGETSN